MRSVGIAVVGGLCSLSVACATSDVLTRASGGANALTVSEQRGRELALRRCGGCHNVGIDEGPPHEGPAFRRLGMRYNPISLERRFAEVSEHGSEGMPPVSLTRAEAGDLIDYIDTLPAP